MKCCDLAQSGVASIKAAAQFSLRSFSVDRDHVTPGAPVLQRTANGSIDRRSSPRYIDAGTGSRQWPDRSGETHDEFRNQGIRSRRAAAAALPSRSARRHASRGANRQDRPYPDLFRPQASLVSRSTTASSSTSGAREGAAPGVRLEIVRRDVYRPNPDTAKRLAQSSSRATRCSSCRRRLDADANAIAPMSGGQGAVRRHERRGNDDDRLCPISAHLFTQWNRISAREWAAKKA